MSLALGPVLFVEKDFFFMNISSFAEFLHIVCVSFLSLPCCFQVKLIKDDTIIACVFFNLLSKFLMMSYILFIAPFYQWQRDGWIGKTRKANSKC